MASFLFVDRYRAPTVRADIRVIRFAKLLVKNETFSTNGKLKNRSETPRRDCTVE